MLRHCLVLLLSLSALLPTAVAEEPLPPGALRRLPEVAPAAGNERMRSVREVRISADGKVVITRKADGTIQVWDRAGGKLRRQWRLPEKTMAVTLSPDGKVVAAVDRTNNLVLHAADSGELLRRFRDPLPGTVSCLAFTPDGKAIFSGHVEPAQFCTWDVAAGRRLDAAAWEDNLVVSAAGSPDGAVLALGSLEGALRIWDRAARKDRCRHVEGSRIQSLAFSPDGKLLASVNEDERCVRLWDTRTCQPVRDLPWRGPQAALVVFSPDGKLLACAAGRSVLLWETATGRERHSFSGDQGAVTAAAFTADGKRLLTGGRDGTVLVWDLTAPLPAVPPDRAVRTDHSADPLPRAARARLGSVRLLVPEGRPDEELPLAFSADGRLLYVGMPPPANAPGEKDRAKPAERGPRPADGPPGIAVLEVATGKEGPGLEDAPEGVDCLACSPDGKTLAALVGPTLYRWDIPRGNQRKLVHIDLSQACALLYSPDGRLLAAAGEEHVGLFDADSGRCLHLLPGDPPGTIDLAFSRDGKRLISCSRPGKGWGGRDTTIATVWDVADGKSLRRLHFSVESGLRPLRLSPEGGALAVGDNVRGLQLLNLSGEEPLVYPAATAVAFSPDGKLLAAAGDRLRLLRRSSGLEVYSRPFLDAPVRQMLFSPDGKLLAIVANGRLHFWDVAGRQETIPHEGHSDAVAALSLSADGRLLLSGGADGNLCVWDAATGKMQRRIRGHSAAVNTVALSPDGKRAASLDADGLAYVWDTGSGRQLLRARMYRDPAAAHRQHVAFTADGQSLVIADLDGLVEVRRLSAWREPRSLPGPDHPNPQPALSPDDRLLTLCNESGTETSFISLREVSTGARRWRVEHPHPDGVFLAAAFAPGGRLVAVSRASRLRSGSFRLRDCRIALHESTTGTEVRTWDTGLPVSVLAFSPDGKVLATATGWDIRPWQRDASADPLIQLWDVRTGRPLGKVAGGGLVTALTFAADGRTLFSASSDGTILAWDVRRLPLRQSRRPHESSDP